MTYDFTSIMNRHGMDSIAVDGLGVLLQCLFDRFGSVFP